jgi:hypothetical protein
VFIGHDKVIALISQVSPGATNAIDDESSANSISDTDSFTTKSKDKSYYRKGGGVKKIRKVAGRFLSILSFKQNATMSSNLVKDTSTGAADIVPTSKPASRTSSSKSYISW